VRVCVRARTRVCICVRVRVVRGIEFRAWHLLDKCFTTLAQHPLLLLIF
jgi:hypothetical protein